MSAGKFWQPVTKHGSLQVCPHRGLHFPVLNSVWGVSYMHGVHLWEDVSWLGSFERDLRLSVWVYMHVRICMTTCFSIYMIYVIVSQHHR